MKCLTTSSADSHRLRALFLVSWVALCVPLGAFAKTSLRASQPDRAPIDLGSFAPEPRIRVGLSTRTRVVRLTSSAPFRIEANAEWLETQDVLVERELGPASGGLVYRIELASYPERGGAAELLERVSEELEEDISIEREAGTGRFSVRVGNFGTEAGARALLQELTRLGFETAKLLRTPTTESRPTRLILRAAGQAPVATAAMTLLTVPASSRTYMEVDGRPYRGYIELSVNRTNQLTVVNIVNLEEYLRGVVPAELSPGAFPEVEALKAQAIAARTYAVKRAGEYLAEGFDLCATPACQVYRGVSVEDPMSNEAVVATKGEILTYGGEPVDALYTSTCGGRTENVENVFQSAKPYLVSRACLLESQRGSAVTSGPAKALPLEAAALQVSGVVAAAAPPSLASAATATGEESRRWLSSALRYIGQSACFGSDAASTDPFDIVALTEMLAEGLCWSRRVPFVMSERDAERLVGLPTLPVATRRNLAYAIQQRFVRPPAEGIEQGRVLTRAEVLQCIYRLVTSRGEAPLTPGTLKDVQGERLVLRDDTLEDEDNEIVTFLAPARYLFHRSGDVTYYTERLELLPNDKVLYHMGESGIDLLVLNSDGATFDRSSRFSNWVVRKVNDELSREVNLREPVGLVKDLRPKRYGVSGRVAELEVVGSTGTVTLTGLAIRRALGIRENLFFLDAQRAPDGTPQAWVFTGRGWGHGVGLCQVGAYGMAAAGYSYRQILAHYYPGTELRLDVDIGSVAP